MAAELAADLAFDLPLIAPASRRHDVPEGPPPASWLRELTRQGRHPPLRRPAGHPGPGRVLNHDSRSLKVPGIPKHFPIVHAITSSSAHSRIHGRREDAATNSLQSLRQTYDRWRVISVIFRRTANHRGGGCRIRPRSKTPLEIHPTRYSRYGRETCAQIANVISYRPRSAVRDAARALSHPAGVQDAWIADGAVDLSAPRRLTGQNDRVPSRSSTSRRSCWTCRRLGVHPGGADYNAADRHRSLPGALGRHGQLLGPPMGQDDCAEAELVGFGLHRRRALTPPAASPSPRWHNGGRPSPTP